VRSFRPQGGKMKFFLEVVGVVKEVAVLVFMFLVDKAISLIDRVCNIINPPRFTPPERRR